MENPPQFRFRLERIRSVRERVEDQAREDLAASLAVRLKGEGMLRAAEAELRAAQENRSATEQAATGIDLVSAQAYVEHAERRREARMLDLDRADAEVDARREALVQAAKDRQALERLKERKRQEHELESQRIAGIALDEMSLNMHRRQAAA